VLTNHYSSISYSTTEATEEFGQSGNTGFADCGARLHKYGAFEGLASEVTAYGGTSARDMLIFSFLICDGDKTRSRRKILMDKKWRFMGVSVSPHDSVFEVMGLLVFTPKWEERVDKLVNAPNFSHVIVEPTKAEKIQMLAEEETAQALQQLELQPSEDDNYLLLKQKLNLSVDEVALATASLVKSQSADL